MTALGGPFPEKASLIPSTMVLHHLLVTHVREHLESLEYLVRNLNSLTESFSIASLHSTIHSDLAYTTLISKPYWRTTWTKHPYNHVFL